MPAVVRAMVGSSPDLVQVSVEVHHELNQHSWCFAEFRATSDQRPAVDQWLGQPLVVEVTVEGATTAIFNGMVWQCELHHDIRAGFNALVTGVSRSWKLEVTHDQHAFTAKDLAAIASELASEDGVTAQVSLSADAPWSYIVQWGVPDLRFLVQRAYERGAWIRTTASGIEIRDTFDAGQPIQWADRLTHYSVVGRLGSPASTGTYYDPSTTVSSTLSAVTAEPEFLTSTAMTSAVMSASQSSLPSGGLYRQSHGTEQADFEDRLKLETIRNLSNAYVVGISGEPRLAVGNLLQIEGLAEGNGSCGVIQAVHTWTQAVGYKNQFVATLSAKWINAESPRAVPPARVWQVPDRPGLYPTGPWVENQRGSVSFNDPRTPLRHEGFAVAPVPISMGNSQAEFHGRQFLGVVVARVVSNQDPSHMGRLKVQYIWSDQPTDWIRMISPSAGAGRGILFLPEVGDEVLVAFEDGNPNLPVVIGSLWNSANNNQDVRQPFRSEAGVLDNDIKRIVTKSGLRITLCDTAGEQGLTLVTPFGCSIKMLERHPETGFPMIAIETTTGDIFLGAPEGRVHINSKFYSKEIG